MCLGHGSPSAAVSGAACSAPMIMMTMLMSMTTIVSVGLVQAAVTWTEVCSVDVDASASIAPDAWRYRDCSSHHLLRLSRSDFRHLDVGNVVSCRDLHACDRRW